MNDDQKKPVSPPDIEASRATNKEDAWSDSVQEADTLSDTVSDKPTPKKGDIPQRIGRYRVEWILGKGEFGIVYLAHDDESKRRVAIKIPKSHRVSSPEDVVSIRGPSRGQLGPSWNCAST